MPKPNKYNADGSLKQGRNVGPEPHLAAPRLKTQPNSKKETFDVNKFHKRVVANIRNILAVAGLIIFLILLFGALQGCAVNVITMPDATIVIDGELVTQQVIKAVQL